MDQNVILVETVPLEFDLESLGCRLRIRPGQTKFMDRLSRLAEEAARVARPKAVARLCGLTILDEEKVQVGEVTFSSPLLQRRVLVVLLPSLEKAPAELASLGKISLSAIRNACAVGLGAHIEGDAADVLEALPTDTVGIGPYLCIVDEYAAIVTPGFEVVLTQGRGLGIAAIVASQDYAGILEADKKGAQQMVANTSIKIFMKMQDAEKTWELIRGQAGQGTVLRTTGFNVNEKISAGYRDAMNTTVEQEDRVVLRDLQEQIEGEAHFIFSGQIVRGTMFFANPSLKKAQLRVPQLVQLSQEKHYDHAA